MALSPKLLHVLSKVGCDAFSQGFPAIHISQDFLVSSKGVPAFGFVFSWKGKVDLGLISARQGNRCIHYIAL